MMKKCQIRTFKVMREEITGGGKTDEGGFGGNWVDALFGKEGIRWVRGTLEAL